MSGYDERLLASAPVATRAEKQEGYNIDILDEPKNNARSTSATPPLPVPALSTDHSRAEAGGYVGSVQKGYARSATTTPWYKTRKWLTIFLIGGIVIVAAVVGGAVGGTAGKNKSSESASTATASVSGQDPGAAAPSQTAAATGVGDGSPGNGQQATSLALPPQATSGDGGVRETQTQPEATGTLSTSPTGSRSQGGPSEGDGDGGNALAGGAAL